MSTNKPEKIVILNYQTGQVYILDYDSNLFESPEDFFALEEMSSIPLNDCHYMVVIAEELQLLFSPQ